jgi:DNA-binding NarL/FixJ family response regulator
VTTVQRIVVVDDLPASREWLARAAARAFPGAEVEVFADLAGALGTVPAPPDLALVDLGLPDGSGISYIAALREASAPTLCVVATVFDDDAHLFPALSAGAQGYVLKDLALEDLVELLRGIVSGQPPLSPSIARRLLRHFSTPPVEVPQSLECEGAALTPRETDVLRLIGKGFTVVEAAEALGLSRHTCAGYVKEIYRKLRVGSRAEATLAASRLGLVSPAAR